MKLQPYQCLVVLHGKKLGKDETQEPSRIISDGMQIVMAENEKQAGMIAAKKYIPDEFITEMSRVEVVIRPF